MFPTHNAKVQGKTGFPKTFQEYLLTIEEDIKDVSKYFSKRKHVQIRYADTMELVDKNYIEPCFVPIEQMRAAF